VVSVIDPYSRILEFLDRDYIHIVYIFLIFWGGLLVEHISKGQKKNYLNLF
jgi:hypothetical protein